MPSAEQVTLVTTAWTKVRAIGLLPAGELFFRTLFTAHPEGLALFKSFSSLPDYEQSEAFKEHSLTVFTALDKALSLLGDLDTLLPVLGQLGDRHVQYGVTAEHYDWIGESLIGTLRTALGADFTEETEKAYLCLYAVIAQTMKGDNYPKPDAWYNNGALPITHVVTAIDERDKKTPDSWVPRHPDLIRLTGKHPFNCEPPLETLFHQGFITPPSLHYVRNHGYCPKQSWDEHVISIDGVVDTPLTLTMAELVAMPSLTIPVTLVCAGNRRKEQNMVKQTIGFNWGAAGHATGFWTGVRLRDILMKAGYNQSKARHVEFVGAEDLPNGKYGTSIDINTAMDPAGDVMIAYYYNGERLEPDHGFPVRVIIPGWIGGRMVKWLKSVSVRETPSENYYHFYDNRIMPPHVDAELAKKEGWWFKPENLFNELNINSAIACPHHGEVVPLTPGNEYYSIRGYAYGGGGRKITRVEVSYDCGSTWNLCEVEYPELEHSYAPKINNKWWCWCFFSIEAPMLMLMQCKELRCRAWDESSNLQPADLTWNLMGMGNNPHFRVEIHPVSLSNGGFGVRFVHPTMAGPVTDEEGKLVSGGWMGTPDAPRESRGVAEGLGRPAPLTVLGGIPGTVAPPTAALPISTIGSLFAPNSALAKASAGPPVGATRPVTPKTSPKASLTSSGPPAQSPSILRKGSDSSIKKSGSKVSIAGVSSASEGDDIAAVDRIGESYTMEEIERHNTEDSCWIVVNGIVYDTTNYLKKHPGGVTSITMNGGEDCSEEFTSIHSKKAWDDLEEWRIGFTVEAKDDESRMTYSKSSTHLLTEAYQRAEAAAGKTIERVEHDFVALNPKKWLSFPLAEKIVMSPDTALFRFALPSPEHRTGLPTGWHIFLRYRDAKGSLVMRAYTPTSLNTELGVVDFVIKVYRPCDRFPDGGKMSQYIDTLQIGDGLEMRGPVGHFEYLSAGNIVLNGESLSGKKFGFMCGGTGISPAYQVIKYSLTTEPDADVRFCLVYGNQTPGDILLKEEIDLLAAAHPQRLTVHYTVDRIDDDAKAAWADAGFSVGFIDTQMCEKILGRDCDFVGVCGPPGMIKFACRPALQELGYGDEEIGKQSEDSTQPPSKYFLF